MTNAFAVQDEICQAIVDELNVELVADRLMVKRYTANLEASNLYLKARCQLNKLASEGMAKSKEY